MGEKLNDLATCSGGLFPFSPSSSPCPLLALLLLEESVLLILILFLIRIELYLKVLLPEICSAEVKGSLQWKKISLLKGPRGPPDPAANIHFWHELSR